MISYIISHLTFPKNTLDRYKHSINNFSFIRTCGKIDHKNVEDLRINFDSLRSNNIDLSYGLNKTK